jgi:hypothetical protein
MKLGAPKYEQNKKNYFSFKKNQNTFILRVLPPMGGLADSGKWSLYHRVEFGYTGTDGKLRPFLSPRVVNYNGMVEVESETHKRRESIKTQQAQAKKAGNAALVEQCTKMLQKYNQDAKHHMNVVDLQGNVGLFKIGHKGFQALKAEVDRLRSEGIDPIGVENGRFFVFSRTGSGRDTLYTVTEYKQKQEIATPTGKVTAMVDFPHSITDSIMSKLSTDAFELDKIYPTVTPEEEHRIVHDGPTAVDEILGSKKTRTEGDSKAVTTSSVTSAATAVTSPAAVTTTAVSEDSFYEDEDEAAVGNFSGFSDVADMSEEDFFKKVESGNF